MERPQNFANHGLSNGQVRAAITPGQNVGDETADAIARKFASVRELRQAEREDLTAIHGVGETTAAAVLSRVRNGRE